MFDCIPSVLTLFSTLISSVLKLNFLMIFPIVQPILFPGDVVISQIAHHSESKHFLALSHTREVFSWGSGESGQLGLGDIK